MKVVKKVNMIKIEIDLDSESSIKEAIELLGMRLLEMEEEDDNLTSIVKNPNNKIKIIKKIRQFGKDCVERHDNYVENPSSLRFSKELVEDIVSSLS